VEPERLDELPGVAGVGGVEEAAGDGAAPEVAGAVGVGGLEAPDEVEGPLERLARAGVEVGGAAFGEGGVGGAGDLCPGLAGVAGAVELDAEVAVVEGGVERAVAGVVQGR